MESSEPAERGTGTTDPIDAVERHHRPEDRLPAMVLDALDRRTMTDLLGLRLDDGADAVAASGPAAPASGHAGATLR